LAQNCETIAGFEHSYLVEVNAISFDATKLTRFFTKSEFAREIAPR